MSNAPDAAREARQGDPRTVTPLRVVVALCLIAPFVAMLWVSSYAKVDPAFIGIPFFYWYQMLWVVISTALTMLAYQLWKRDQASRKAAARSAQSSEEGAGA
jgi:membrane protein implicated in regulation of membrane protease activity